MRDQLAIRLQNACTRLSVRPEIAQPGQDTLVGVLDNVVAGIVEDVDLRIGETCLPASQEVTDCEDKVLAPQRMSIGRSRKVPSSRSIASTVARVGVVRRDRDVLDEAVDGDPVAPVCHTATGTRPGPHASSVSDDPHPATRRGPRTR